MQLEIRDLYKSFGEKQVLKGISFTAKDYNAFGLLGRNGAGKTTTIRIIMDVFSCDGGEVLLDGKPIDCNKIKIGYLPEERGLYPKKHIFSQLVYFAALKGMSKKEAEKSVNYWLERLEMTEYKNKKLETLSKGNQQKIQLITALAHNPQIIILDEPFSGLDPVNAMLLKDVVKEEIAKGKIVIFSSHQMNYIEEFCNEIAIITDGQIALSGDISEIKRNYRRDKLIIRSTQNTRILNNFKNCKPFEKDSIILTLASPDDKKQVMETLTEQYDIDEIKVYEPSLNDIFIEYAGDSNKEVQR